MSALDYHEDMARLLREAQAGDEVAEELVLRLSLRRSDRETALSIAKAQIERIGIESATFSIDEEGAGLSIPETLFPVLYESPGGLRVTLCWDARIARLFAADCAEHVLHFFEAEYPDDVRPREAIEVARRFVRGEATQLELRAAYAAARAAVTDAVWHAAVAAWADEREWQLARLLEYLLGEAASCSAD